MVRQPEPLPLPIRDLPRFRDLSAFLGHLDAAGQLRRIAEPISVVHEITEIHRRVIAGNGPALLFERPLLPNGTISSMPLLTNLFGTVERVAWGLGVEAGHLPALGGKLAELREPRPPRGLTEAWQALPLARAALSRPPPDCRPAPGQERQSAGGPGRAAPREPRRLRSPRPHRRCRWGWRRPR